MATVQHTIEIIDNATSRLKSMSKSADKATSAFGMVTQSTQQIEKAQRKLNTVINKFTETVNILNQTIRTLNKNLTSMNTCVQSNQTSMSNATRSTNAYTNAVKRLRQEINNLNNTKVTPKTMPTLKTGNMPVLVPSGGGGGGRVGGGGIIPPGMGGGTPLALPPGRSFWFGMGLQFLEAIPEAINNNLQPLIELGRNAGNLFDSLSNALTSTISNLHTGFDYISQIMSAVDNIRSKKALFENLSGLSPTDKGYVSGSEQWQALYQISQETRTPITETQDLFARMLMSRVFAPESAVAGSLKMTQLINKSMIASGATAQQTKSGMLQFGQAMARGKLGGEDYKSMRQQVPGFLNILSDALKKKFPEIFSTGSMADWNAAGLTTSTRIAQALIAYEQDLQPLFEKMPVSFEQWIVRLTNLGQGLINWFEESEIFTPVYVAMNKLWNSINSPKNMEFFNKLFDIASAFAKGLAKVIDSVTAMFDSGGATEMLNTLVDVVATLAEMAMVWIRWQAIVLTFKLEMAKLYTNMGEAFLGKQMGADSPEQRLENLGQKFQETIDWIKTCTDTLRPFISGLAKASLWIQGMFNFVVGIGKVFAGFKAGAALGSFIPGIGTIGGGILGGLGALGALFIGGPGQALEGMVQVGAAMSRDIPDVGLRETPADKMHLTAEPPKFLAGPAGAIPGTIDDILYADKQIAENTGKMANKGVRIEREDLEYLKDLATNNILLGVNTAAPQVNVNTGDINNGMQFNDVVARIMDAMGGYSISVQGPDVITLAQ